MTEVAWRTCIDPILMLNGLRNSASDDMLRQFAVGCSSLWVGLDIDGRASAAHQVVQKFIAGQASIEDLLAANKDAWRSFDLGLPENAALNAIGDASHTDLAIMLTHKDAWHSAYCVSWIIGRKLTETLTAQCDLLRDIFGKNQPIV